MKKIASGGNSGLRYRICPPLFVSRNMKRIWWFSTIGCGTRPITTLIVEQSSLLTLGMCASWFPEPVFGSSSHMVRLQHEGVILLSCTLVMMLPHVRHLKNLIMILLFKWFLRDLYE